MSESETVIYFLPFLDYSSSSYNIKNATFFINHFSCCPLTFITYNKINKVAYFFVIGSMTCSWCYEPPIWEFHCFSSNCSVYFPAADKSLDRNPVSAQHETMFSSCNQIWYEHFWSGSQFESGFILCVHANRTKHKAAYTTLCNTQTVSVGKGKIRQATWRSPTDCWAGSDMEGSGRGIISRATLGSFTILMATTNFCNARSVSNEPGGIGQF